MSSNAYSTEIYPEASLRRIVLASGALLAVAGVVLIACLPLSGGGRLFGIAAWLATATRELVRLARAYRYCRGLRFSSEGDIAVLGPDLKWRAADLVPGGILLRRMGWIRVATRSRPAFGELVRGNRRTDHNWRRLHVIWRHIGARI